MTTTDVTTGSDQGLDDPALLAEIEAEFAELTKEIERISAMPRTMAPQKSQLVEALRASWRERLEARGDRPEWRQRLDRTIGNAVDRLLEEGIQENPDGSLAFALRGETLQQEGGPLLKGLVEGFAHMMMEKFPAPDAAKPPAPDAPPATPMQQILGSLGHTLANALQNAVKQFSTGSGTPDLSAIPPGSSATVALGGGEMKVDIQARPPEATADGIGQKASFALEGEQDLSASFEIDTRKLREARDSAGAPATDAEPSGPGSSTTSSGPSSEAPTASGGAPSPAANAFFQQLFSGLGQAVQQALAPAAGAGGLGQFVTQAIAKAFNAPGAPPPSEPRAGPAPAAASTTVDPSSTAPEANAPEGPAPEVNAARAPSPAAAPGADPSPAPTSSSSDTAPEGQSDATPGVAADAPSPPMLTATETNPKGDSPATMQIDLAGILGQLLGSLKLPPKT